MMVDIVEYLFGDSPYIFPTFGVLVLAFEFIPLTEIVETDTNERFAENGEWKIPTLCFDEFLNL